MKIELARRILALQAEYSQHQDEDLTGYPARDLDDIASDYAETLTSFLRA